MLTSALNTSRSLLSCIGWKISLLERIYVLVRSRLLSSQ